MSGQLFINYRRGDDPGFTGRLFDRLEDAFTADQLFMDVDSIAPGLDFVRVLEEHVGKCDIFLAVIGPNWLDARDEAGNRRLDNPNDFVRIEIESALQFGKRIIPISSTMPTCRAPRICRRACNRSRAGTPCA
jgi:TIR domain-containing protein